MNRESITREQKYFIQLLKDYVHQNRSEEPDKEFDWLQLYHIAKEQDLCGIVYVQCRNMKSIQTDVKKLLGKAFLSEAYLSVNTDHALNEITKSFNDHSIDHLQFKGSLIRNYYPNPELRTMGDRDILIHQKDCEKADQIMLSLGYDKMVDNHAVWTYTKPHLMFEIHNVMFYDPLPNQIDYREYFNHIWDSASKEPGQYECIPDLKMHFLYMIAHTAKHITNNGIGFRAFLDICFFCINALPVDQYPQDWEWIQNELIKLQLFEFSKVCFMLCNRWFDISLPYLTDAISEFPFEQIELKIFKDGIFGLENTDNAGAHIAMEIRRASHKYLLTSLRITLKKIFPPYQDLQLVPWYSWIDGKPWLLPLAWIYRWFYCLFHKGKWSINLLLEPITEKKQIKKRDEYLEYWGL